MMFEFIRELLTNVRIIKRNTEEIKRLLKKGEFCLVLITIINKSKFQIMSLTLDVKQFVAGTLGLVDHTTGAVVAATFANEVFKSDDETIFTAALQDDGTVDITGVASGTANLEVSADATYTDANTQQEVTVNKSVIIPVTISQPINPEETDLVVNFGQAQGVQNTPAA